MAIKKAILYARVSSKEQEKEGFSIPAQLRLLKHYANEKFLKIVKEFLDVETAKQAGRTKFNEMVRFLKSNSEVKIILCEKTDRLYRNFRDYVTIDDLDLEIHLVKEGEILSKDSKSHQKLTHGIKLLMAKNYIDNLSEETKKGMAEKVAQGGYPHYAPFGYVNDKVAKIIVVDEASAVMVKKLFELYSSGSYSIETLRQKTWEEGLTYRSGKKLSKGTIEKILKNPFYTGQFKWKGIIYQGSHPALISQGLFNQVQLQLKSHNKPRGRKRNFAFTGMIQCGKCGCLMTAEIKKEKYVYYHCTGYKGKCGQSYIREEALSDKLGEAVKKIQIDEDTLSYLVDILKDAHEEEKEYHNSILKNLNEQHKKIQGKIDKAYSDKLEGNISDDFWLRQYERLKEQQDEILAKIERHQNANRGYIESGVKILELSKKAYSLYSQNPPQIKRQILNFLLSNCTFDDGSLSFTYKKPFDLIAEGLQTKNWLLRRDSNPRPGG